MQLYTGGKTGLQSGSACQEDLQADIDSDSEEFGGCGRQRPQSYKAVEAECDGRPYRSRIPLEPYGVAVFRVTDCISGLVKCEEQLNNGADMTDIYISYEWRIVLCAIFMLHIRLLYIEPQLKR